MPLSINRKINKLRYWTSILRQAQNSLVKIVYLSLLNDCENGHTYNGNNWAYIIKNILQQNGLGYMWFY